MKTRAFFAVACVLMFAAQSVSAQAQTTLFSAPELDFFCRYMLGKEFSMPADAEKTRRLDGGKVELEFDFKNRYANLVVSPEGFSFNVLSTTKRTYYDLNAEGKRILPGRNMDRTIVQKHQFGRSKSTGKIVGHREILYNDSPDANFGMAGNMTLFMEGDKLVNLFLPGGYTDLAAAEGKFKPGTVSARAEFVVKDGKIIRTSVSETFDVDPETLKMTPTGEKTTTISVAELGDGK
jgi:hypothetical protein